jgi:hypothetical protein
MSNTVLVQDNQDIFEISFSDVEKYHGLSNIAGAAVGFKALQAAFEALLPGQPAPREEITIKTGHPGSGVRDAIEMVTRATTRGVYTVDKTLPKARLNPHRQLSFSFIVSLRDREAEAVLKEGILPARFFDLMEIVTKLDTGKELAELNQLKRSLAKEIVGRSSAELFVVTTDSRIHSQ